jgi:hypothetical protein
MDRLQNKSDIDKLRERAESLIKNSTSSGALTHSLLYDIELSNIHAEEKIPKLIHELKVHQIELEMQNDELILANRQKEVDYDKYVELYDFAPVGYFTLSGGGDIMGLNLNGAKMLGKERLLLAGFKFASFVSSGTKATFRLFLERVFSSQAKEFCEVTLQTKGRVQIYAHLIGISSGDGKHCFVIAVDMTEKKVSKVKFA